MTKTKNISQSLLAEIIGWYGTIAIISAYGLSSFHVLNVNDPLYQVLNGTGAIGIVIISLKKKAYQPAALNTVWTLIAVIALIQLLFMQTR